MHVKRRKNILRRTKGYLWGRKNKIKLAKVAVLKAGVHAYRSRKRKKRDFRAQWNIQINAAVRPYNMSYSRFIHALKEHKIGLDRKILAHLAEHEPEIFQKVVETVKK